MCRDINPFVKARSRRPSYAHQAEMIRPRAWPTRMKTSSEKLCLEPSSLLREFESVKSSDKVGEVGGIVLTHWCRRLVVVQRPREMPHPRPRKVRRLLAPPAPALCLGCVVRRRLQPELVRAAPPRLVAPLRLREGRDRVFGLGRRGFGEWTGVCRLRTRRRVWRSSSGSRLGWRLYR